MAAAPLLPRGGMATPPLHLHPPLLQPPTAMAIAAGPKGAAHTSAPARRSHRRLWLVATHGCRQAGGEGGRGRRLSGRVGHSKDAAVGLGKATAASAQPWQPRGAPALGAGRSPDTRCSLARASRISSARRSSSWRSWAEILPPSGWASASCGRGRRGARQRGRPSSAGRQAGAAGQGRAAGARLVAGTAPYRRAATKRACSQSHRQPHAGQAASLQPLPSPYPAASPAPPLHLRLPTASPRSPGPAA